MTLLSPLLSQITDAFALPSQCRVDQRIPKKLLLENYHPAPSAADKRLINDTLASIDWLAALKPHTCAIPAHRSPERDYLEIALIATTAKPGRPLSASQTHTIAQRIHRAIPYPVILLQSSSPPRQTHPTESNDPTGSTAFTAFTAPTAAPSITLSLAHKRQALNDPSRTALDGELCSITLTASELAPTQPLAALLPALALRAQASSAPAHHSLDLYSLYQNWYTLLQAAHAARITGQLNPATSSAHAAARSKALSQHSALSAQAAQLRAQQQRPRLQLAQQVALNLQLQHLHTQLQALHSQL